MEEPVVVMDNPESPPLSPSTPGALKRPKMEVDHEGKPVGM